jgi:hypothetical protein
MSSPGFSIKNRIQFFEAQAELNKDAPKPVGKAVGPCVKPLEPEKPKKPPVTVKIQEKPSLVIVRARPGSSANTGTLHAIEASPPGGEYLWTVKGSAPVDVPGDKTSSSLTVTEKAVGGVAVEVRYTYDGDSACDTTQVEVRAPLIQVNPSLLEFPKLLVGKTSEVKTFTVQNTGEAPLQVDEIRLNPDSGDFEIVNAGSIKRTIEPSDAPVPIKVLFKPREGGQKNCGLVIRSNALNKPEFNLPISGTGLEPRIEATTLLSFTPHLLGAEKLLEHVKIKNTGKSDLTISEIVGEAGDHYSVDLQGWKGKAIPPGQEVTLPVSFKPKSAGESGFRLTIKSDALNEIAWPVEIKGSAIRPVIGVTPDPMDFGNFHLKDKSGKKELTIRNSGDGDLHITNITLSKNPDAQWTLGAFEKLVKVGEAIKVELEFEAKATNKFEGELIIESDADNDKSKKVKLTAAAFEIENLVMPEFLAAGAEEVELTYTVRDPAGIISEGTFEVLVTDGSRVVHTRALNSGGRTDEYKDGSRTVKWKGKIEGAAAGEFPDEHVSIQFSPYKVKITASAPGALTKGVIEREFKVEAEKLELEPGDKAVLALKKYKDVYDGALPAKGGKKELYLLSDIFCLDNNVNEDHHDDRTDYTQYETMWGNGPLIPVQAKVFIKKSAGPSVLAPLAWGNAKVMWEHKSVDKVKGTLADRPWNYVNDAQTRFKDATNPVGDNCPGDENTPAEDFGGKRTAEGQRSHYLLPGSYGTDVVNFPFPVTAGGTRKWVAFSQAEKTDGHALYGKTGVVFQPSRMAGDKYELHAYLDAKVKYDKTGTITEPIHDYTGTFEIWRELEIRQTYLKDPGITKYAVAEVRKFYDKAYMKVTDHSTFAPFPQAEYDTAFADAITAQGDTILETYAVDQPAGQYAVSGKSAMRVKTWKVFFKDYRNAKVSSADINVYRDADLPRFNKLGGKTTARRSEVRKLLAREQLKSAWGVPSADSNSYKEKCLEFAEEVIMKACNKLMDQAPGDGLVAFFFEYMLCMPGKAQPACPESTMGQAMFGDEYDRCVRNKVAYVQLYPAAQHTAPDTLDATFAHELGHQLFLPHTVTEDAAKDAEAHDRADSHCMMSYNYSKPLEFCGYCLLRLRGWDHDKLKPASPDNKKTPKMAVAVTGAFGVTAKDATSSPQTFTVSNTGTAPLVITAITKHSGDTDQFEILTPPALPCTVAVGGNTTFQVVFKPTAVGDKTMDLRIESNDAGGPRTITVTSTGKVPAITVRLGAVDVTSILFKEVKVDADLAKTVTIFNSGTAPLQIGQITIDGVNHADFSIKNNNTAPAIAVGASATFDLVINASFTGKKNAGIVIASNAADSPKSIPVEARDLGVLVLEPSPQNGGSVTIGAAGAEQSLALKNTGTGKLTLKNIAIGGAKAASFNVNALGGAASRALNQDIGPGKTLNLKWSFKPTEAGALDSTITVTWESDQAEPDKTATLQGTGLTVPDLQAAAVTFVGAKVNVAKKANVVITNAGQTKLVFKLEDITSTNSEFQVQGAPATIEVLPGATANVEIDFTTATPDVERTSTVSIPSNTPGADRTVVVKGTATI